MEGAEVALSHCIKVLRPSRAPMTVGRSNARIVSVRFQNYKALRDFQIRLKDTNVLVGPNNAGKSTIVGAFRALAVALRRIKGRKPEIVNGPDGRRYGIAVPPESLPISIENVHTDYLDEDTLVTFSLSNRNELQLYFPRNGSCVLVAETHSVPILSASAFRSAFPIEVSVVPVLGPVEHKEELVQAETVQRNLATHRASRNFRSYWYHFPDHFEPFADLVKATWPRSEIEKPTMTDHVDGVLSMFCSEDRILRELFWVGSGFQIWCQLLTHLIRARESSVIVIDEPEVYLHADLQRQLVGLLRDFDADIILATHSTEIMGEAEPADLVLIDKRNKVGERIKNVEKLQAAFSSVGSIHTVALSRLAKSRRIIFFEGDRDYKLMRMIARRLGFAALAAGLEIVPARSGGFGSWEKVAAFGWGIENALQDQIILGAIYDRDYFSDEYVTSVETKLQQSISLVHIHRRKEMESYLLIPSVLDRALSSALDDRSRREGMAPVATRSMEAELIEITDKYKATVSSQRIGKEIEYVKSFDKKTDMATLHAKASASFESRWGNLRGRLEIAPGKDVLSDLRTAVSGKYGVSISDSRIISSMSADDVPSDFVDLLQKLDEFRIAPI